MYCIFFCCFKQKSAYEMRISDWSSDVCSSDLRGFRATEGAAEVDAHAIIGGLRIADRQRRTPILEAHARSQATIAAGAGTGHGHLHREIGRASCRERVCQYV